MAKSTARGGYGVKLVRGPVVRLAPHPLTCSDEDEFLALAASLRKERPLAIDLFCGAGGLSLGLEDAGWTVVMGIDHDKEAVETHRHHFPGWTTDWDLADEEVVERVARLARRARVDLVAGGPPCQPFSKAGRSMLRDLVRSGRRPEHDHRSELWQSFLGVVAGARPRAVLMENVPDMALDRDMLVLRTMIDELEGLGYGVTARVVETWRYGVPQFRQRLILVALSEGRRFEWPAEVETPVSLRQAIGDLPPVEGGWRPEGGADGVMPYDAPITSFQREMRRGLPPADHGVIRDHITRPVREDDARAFAQMDHTTRYSDLPEELKRYRDDIFDDKYKRLDYDDLCRTITAHIAKDGYWYIHPEQDRTLTIREAARVQTFPDRFRFAGPPSAAFRQIGNAVPPRLGFHLGRALLDGIEGEPRTVVPTRELSARLAEWMDERVDSGDVGVPWFSEAAAAMRAGASATSEMRWLVVVAEILFDRIRVDAAFREMVWPMVREMARTPEETLRNREPLGALLTNMGREARLARLVDAATWLAEHPSHLEDYERLKAVPGIGEAVAGVACRAVPDGTTDPIVAPNPVLRVAARYSGQPVDRVNKRSDGRMVTATLVGVDDEGAEDPLEANRGALAHLALIELARTVCHPASPSCSVCPLNGSCRERASAGRRRPALPLDAP